MVSKATSIDPSTSYKAISLKDENQRSIALIHNPIYHTQIKHIDIQHHYIRDKVTTRQINL